ncbi:MAG: helix-turn-helix domain-containing protein [bacterium]
MSHRDDLRTDRTAQLPSAISRCLGMPLHTLSLESCAAATGVPPHRLSRIFRRATGAGFGGYVQRLRLERAEFLLATTELDIRSIADEVGYEVTYLYRLFKSVHGVPPGAYRERHTEQRSHEQKAHRPDRVGSAPR